MKRLTLLGLVLLLTAPITALAAPDGSETAPTETNREARDNTAETPTKKKPLYTNATVPSPFAYKPGDASDCIASCAADMERCVANCGDDQSCQRSCRSAFSNCRKGCRNVGYSATCQFIGGPRIIFLVCPPKI